MPRRTHCSRVPSAPRTTIEVLIPDFSGNPELLAQVFAAPVEQLVAHLHAKAVVDALEVVEVEAEDGDLLVVGQFADPLLEVGDRGQPVGEAGDAIGAGGLLQLQLQIALVAEGLQCADAVQRLAVVSGDLRYLEPAKKTDVKLRLDTQRDGSVRWKAKKKRPRLWM